MQKAAGIAQAHASTVRDLRAPDTPRTAEIRSFLGSSAPAQGEDRGFERYRRALDANATRADVRKWPDKSMWKAAGIDPSNARRVRDLHQRRAPPKPACS